MESVARVVANELRHEATPVEESIFGTSDPDEIGELVSGFCEDHLGSRPREGVFYRASAGCVIGVRPDTGPAVVVKAYQERWSKRFLNATQAVQLHLAQRGFPCATPLLSARPLTSERPNLAVAETWLPDPGMCAPTDVGARAVSAAGLARQIDWCRDLPELSGLEDHPLRRPAKGLYPEPHSPIFDFDATAESAEWIDDFAAKAAEQRERDQGPRLVAHTDWSARNVRLSDEAVVAVYDWDSVSLVPESTAVGQAAMTWSVTSEPGGSDFPWASQMIAFIRDYEVAVGRQLTDRQWAAAGASATWLLAYTARCEHALAMTGRAHPRGARGRLLLDGGVLLGLPTR